MKKLLDLIRLLFTGISENAAAAGICDYSGQGRENPTTNPRKAYTEKGRSTK